MSGFLTSLPGKVNTLLNRLTATRANNLDYLDSAVSDCAKTSDSRFNHLDQDISSRLSYATWNSDPRTIRVDMAISDVKKMFVPSANFIYSGTLSTTNTSETNLLTYSGKCRLVELQMYCSASYAGHVYIYIDTYRLTSFETMATSWETKVSIDSAIIATSELKINGWASNASSALYVQVKYAPISG